MICWQSCIIDIAAVATLTVAVADAVTIVVVVAAVVGVVFEVIPLLLCEAFGAMVVTTVCPDVVVAVGINAAVAATACQPHLLLLNVSIDPHWAVYSFGS